jgi:transcriptional regulator with XRE-family HTH domain
MPTTPASTRDLPLAVQIFRAAMEQQLSLANYAQSLGISSESLRAVVTAQLNHVEAATLDQLARVYNRSRETVEQLRIAAPQETFAAWLKRNMEGISQHALRTRVQIDAKTLKRFLNGEMLPDSDQAERLSRALYIDRTEIARVVAANMAHQGDAGRLAATAATTAEQPSPAPAVTPEPATAGSRRTRRQNATSRADPDTAEAAASAAVVVEPALESERPRRTTSRRQATSKTIDAAREALTEADISGRPAARRQVGKSAAADRQTTTTRKTSPIAQRDNPPAAATDSGALPAFNAPSQRSTRKQRRADSESKQGAANAADPAPIPSAVETPASEVAVELDPASDSAPRAPAALAAATTPASTQRPAPPTASTTVGLAPELASVPSILAAETTTLQLTADEVRLIRQWRKLHPHGRRATLHYIGSLLVDD